MSGYITDAARETDALLHAAGELARIMLLEPRQLDRLDRLGGALAALRGGHARSSSPNATLSITVRHGSRLNDCQTVAIRGGGPAPTCRHRRDTRNATLPSVGLDQPAHDQQQRRFPATGRTDDRGHLAGRETVPRRCSAPWSAPVPAEEPMRQALDRDRLRTACRGGLRQRRARSIARSIEGILFGEPLPGFLDRRESSNSSLSGTVCASRSVSHSSTSAAP